jgi:hypothetical protein
MGLQSIGRRLIVAMGVLVLGACGPKATTNPPPQTPSNAEPTSPDAALPMVPLRGKGVVVPSDVKLEPAPADEAAR